MTSESRRQATQDLCARIDQVVSGHEHQHAMGYGPMIEDRDGSTIERPTTMSNRSWERFCRAITSHWRD